jgi:hypothetical protein
MTIESFEPLAHQSPDQRRSFTLDTIADELRDALLALADGFERDTDRTVDRRGQ